MNIKLIVGLLWWFALLPVMLLTTAIAYLLTPIIALPFFVRNDAIAHESSPRDGRERLVAWLYWFQTYDNPLDEGFYCGYGKHQWINRFRANYHSSGLSQYMFRVYWLWRNAIYGFARHPFGATSGALKKIVMSDRCFILTGESSCWFNPFSLHWQYSAGRRLWVGWKLERNERDGLPRKMFVFQPYKKVPK